MEHCLEMCFVSSGGWFRTIRNGIPDENLRFCQISQRKFLTFGFYIGSKAHISIRNGNYGIYSSLTADDGLKYTKDSMSVNVFKDFKTGNSLNLKKEQSSESTAAPQLGAERYVGCYKCNTAFMIGAADVVGHALQCAKCGHSWTGDQSSVFCPVSSSAEKSSESGPPLGSIDCMHFSKCSGCSLSKNVNTPPVAVELQEFGQKRLAIDRNMRIPIICGNVERWRTHAKLAVRLSSTSSGRNLEIGLFEEKSHKVVPIPNCKVHHPAINTVIDILKEEALSWNIVAYDERTLSGMLRYVQVSVERSSGRVILALVWNAEQFKYTAPDAPRLIKALWSRRDEMSLAAIWLTLNHSVGNTVLSLDKAKWKLARADQDRQSGHCMESVLGLQVSFAPYAFRQANLDAFETLLRRVANMVPKGSDVVELFAGVGVIGLALLRERVLNSVTCTELNRLAEDGFQATKNKLPIELQSRARFLAASSSTCLNLLGSCDVIVVDPPRAGLEESVLNYLTDEGFKHRLSRQKVRLIYISCGFSAFQRDSQKLVSAGWVVKLLEGHVFFPGSNHIETLGVFDLEKTTDPVDVFLQQKKNHAPLSGSSVHVPRTQTHSKKARTRKSKSDSRGKRKVSAH